MKRRLVVAMLFASAAATAKPLGVRAGRSGSPPPPEPPPPAPPLEDVPGPSGSASFTADFAVMNGVDGMVVYYDTVTRSSEDPSAYAYRKVSAGDGQTSVVVSGLAAGTYYWRTAGYTGSTVGPLSEEFDEAAA